VEGASANMVRNLKYYAGRGRDLRAFIESIEQYQAGMPGVKDVPALMGLEGNCRQTYYAAFDLILNEFEMNGRSKQPPGNEINALVSFGNMVCYTQALDAIYHTQLNPTISFLHEPGARRYSLALDVAEIFKPILVDRTIFTLVNKREIQAKHFDNALNGCFLNPAGKQVFLRALEARLQETIQHRTLNKKVSYKYLLRLEWVGRMLKLCRRYLHWIQNSVFEGEITEVKLREMVHRARELMVLQEDSLIIFRSREQHWLEKDIVGKERNNLDTFL
jgi:CRISPR-associated protein Cas1